MNEERKYRSIDTKIMSNGNVVYKKNGFFKSLFGMPYTLYYKPTRAAINRMTKIFPARCYDNIHRLVTLGALKRYEDMTDDPNGNVMLTYYISQDDEFLAMQASRWHDFEYLPTTDTFTYYKEEANAIICNMKKIGVL